MFKMISDLFSKKRLNETNINEDINSNKNIVIEEYNLKSIRILRSILEVSFKKMNTVETSGEIIKVLKNNYSLDCVTILINKENYFKIINSDIDPEYKDVAEKYFNDVLEEDTNGKIKCSETFLSYPTAKERNIKYFYAINLKNKNESIGALIIENRSNNGFSEEEFFKIIVENITIVIENSLYLEKINELALKDTLTGVYNRNFLENDLKEKIESNKSFSIAIFDIDFFKKFNDKYGHVFGDKTLKIVANYVTRYLENEDSIYRYGGEEFIIYFHGKTEEETYEIVENIRKGISNILIEDDKNIATVTASFGIYEYNKKDKDIATIVKKVDQALYCSKETGRNKTTLYSYI